MMQGQSFYQLPTHLTDSLPKEPNSPIPTEASPRSSSSLESSSEKMDSTPMENIALMLQFFGAMNYLQMPWNHQKQLQAMSPTPENITAPITIPSSIQKGRKTRTPSGPYRVPYTENQLEILEASFAEDRFAFGEKKEMLVRKTGLSHRQIKVWFQNRRAKDQRKGRASSKTPESSEDSEVREISAESNCHLSWNRQFVFCVQKEETTGEEQLEDDEIDIIH